VLVIFPLVIYKAMEPIVSISALRALTPEGKLGAQNQKSLITGQLL
jgi:hypothetical protein